MISAEVISIMENSCAYFGRAAGTGRRFQGGKELNPHVLPALPVSGPGMEIWKVLEHSMYWLSGSQLIVSL